MFFPQDEYITARHNMTNATFLTEDDLYEVLMQSRKPNAKELEQAQLIIEEQAPKVQGWEDFLEVDFSQF